jgi:hypothetical protein
MMSDAIDASGTDQLTLFSSAEYAGNSISRCGRFGVLYAAASCHGCFNWKTVVVGDEPAFLQNK